MQDVYFCQDKPKTISVTACETFMMLLFATYLIYKPSILISNPNLKWYCKTTCDSN